MLHCPDEKHAINDMSLPLHLFSPRRQCKWNVGSRTAVISMSLVLYTSRDRILHYMARMALQRLGAMTRQKVIRWRCHVKDEEACNEREVTDSSMQWDRRSPLVMNANSSSSLSYLIPSGLRAQLKGQDTPELAMLPQRSQEVSKLRNTDCY